VKDMKKILIIGVVMGGLVLGGCGSTPKTDLQGKALPSNINFESKKEFNWVRSESFAMNISKMGHPAGLGIGLRDNDNPKNTKVDKENNSLFNFYSGYIVGGVLGGFGSLSMDSLSEKARSWKPYFIQKISKRLIDDATNVDASVFMNPLVANLDKVARKKFNSSYVIGAYYNNKLSANFTNIIAISGDFCTVAAQYLNGEGVELNPLREIKYRLVSADVQEITAKENACYVSLESSIVGEYRDDYIIAHKIASTNIGVFFALSLPSDASFPTIFPNEFGGLNVNDGKSRVYTFDAPFVVLYGENYFFDIDEESTPL
jgi:hypothetical protein